MDLVDYAMNFIGKPYIWGGNGPTGFDCSGLVIECMQAFDMWPPGDWNCEGLVARMKTNSRWTEVKDGYRRGDIVFFHNGKKYSHVAIMINENQYIEAGGGDSTCTSIDNSKGLVRIRPLSWRKPGIIFRYK